MTCILYLDDSQVQLESARQTLGAKGHEVRAALTIDEALLCMADGRVELVLIDFHMPGTSGAEALRELRARASPSAGVRFFLYTTDNKAQGESRKLGFHGAILRKGDMAALAAQLEPVMRILELSKLARR